MECQVHGVLPSWINQEECSLPRKGWSFGREGNQPRFLLLGINIKVHVAVHGGRILFHTFGQIFGTWLKRLSNQRPVLNFIKIEYSKHTLLIGVELIESFDGYAPLVYTWLENFLHLFHWESCCFHFSVQPRPTLPTIFFEDYLVLYKTSSKKEEEKKSNIVSQMLDDIFKKQWNFIPSLCLFLYLNLTRWDPND